MSDFPSFFAVMSIVSVVADNAVAVIVTVLPDTDAFNPYEPSDALIVQPVSICPP